MFEDRYGLFAEYIPDHNSALVDRYLAAGLVIFGRSTSPEFGLTTTTESRVHGQTHNPWNLAHTAGGSSGGAAASVAESCNPSLPFAPGSGAKVSIDEVYAKIRNEVEAARQLRARNT